MQGALEELVRKCTNAERATRLETVQPLWEGYGELVRMRLEGEKPADVVVKWVKPPRLASHLATTAEGRSHARKLRSYAVEMEFYETFSVNCDDTCRVPVLLGVRREREQLLLVLEDLTKGGYHPRVGHATLPQVHAVLRWLAAFHATFLGDRGRGLWPIGSYWHLSTRQDELTRIRDPRLRKWAPRIDERLNRCKFKTLIHGDAKGDNFCWRRAKMEGSSGTVEAAAVDFQYVGRGCGMKDVAYLMSCVWGPSECAAYEEPTLTYYFEALGKELARKGASSVAPELEAEWRSLYPFAWADFQRFLAGWAPGQYDDDPYAQMQIERVMAAPRH